MGCTRADKFLSKRGIAVRETVDAKKQRYAAKDLKDLFRGARRIIAARGAKDTVFEVKRDGFPPAEELERVALGPSGNLRAPTLRLGSDWLVGFGEPAWERTFGARGR